MLGFNFFLIFTVCLAFQSVCFHTYTYKVVIPTLYAIQFSEFFVLQNVHKALLYIFEIINSFIQASGRAQPQIDAVMAGIHVDMETPCFQEKVT